MRANDGDSPEKIQLPGAPTPAQIMDWLAGPSTPDGGIRGGFSARSRGRGEFDHRRIFVPPDTQRTYDSSEWRDCLIIVGRGRIELEGLAGVRLQLGPGSIFWLTGLPLQWIHNPGTTTAELVVIARASI